MEEELINKAKALDPTSTMKLLKMYNHNINILIRKEISNFKYTIYNIDDIKQEVNLAFLKAVNSYDKEKDIKFKTYIEKTITNKIKDLVRHLNRNKNQIFENSISLDDDSLIENHHNRLLIEECTIDDDIYIEQSDSILKDKLTTDELKVYELKKEGLSNKDLSYILDKPIKNINNTYLRIKHKIKEYFN